MKVNLPLYAKFTVNIGASQFMKELSLEQQTWAASHFSFIKHEALAGDAGFRRYFRLYLADKTLIFMDASQEIRSYDAFIQQSKDLNSIHFPIPQLFAQEDSRHWAIIEDFGDELLFKVLSAASRDFSLADQYYKEAMDHALVLHGHPGKAYGSYSILDEALIYQELLGWQEWCLQGLFQESPPKGLSACYEKIINKVVNQPYVFMHRDYHSKNILIKKNHHLGVIDYQDAMQGPMTYDIASLLRDCYIDWPKEWVKNWALYYKKGAQEAGLLSIHVGDEEFLQGFDWVSIQRHLKALFTFSRKALRDKNESYLLFVPRTLSYLYDISASYPDLSDLRQVIEILREKI